MGKKSKVRTKKTTASKQASPKRRMQGGKQTPLFWVLAASAIIFLCFFPMLKNGFTNWDDEFYVLNNALLRGPDWKGIFSDPVVSNYHPLTVLSLALNYAISGPAAWSYLLFNLLFHIVNVLLVF